MVNKMYFPFSVLVGAPATRPVSCGGLSMGRSTETAFLYCMNDQCRARLIRADMLHPIADYEELSRLGMPVQQGWCVRDVFDFENVAFSRQQREGSASTGDTDGVANERNPHAGRSALRYLCCGECEWGPVGYAVLEGRQHPLIVVDQNRVAQ